MPPKCVEEKEAVFAGGFASWPPTCGKNTYKYECELQMEEMNVIHLIWSLFSIASHPVFGLRWGPQWAIGNFLPLKKSPKIGAGQLIPPLFRTFLGGFGARNASVQICFGNEIRMTLNARRCNFLHLVLNLIFKYLNQMSDSSWTRVGLESASRTRESKL